jgi:hypothetical protein
MKMVGEFINKPKAAKSAIQPTTLFTPTFKALADYLESFFYFNKTSGNMKKKSLF